MELAFKPMAREFASEMMEWSYEPSYEVYGFGGTEPEPTLDYLCDEQNRFYALLSQEKLIGFRSFGDDGRVAGGDYDDDYLDTGGGLRPDLTGQGLGADVILKGLEFGRRTFGIRRFRTTVADFNLRAQKVCERIGFKRQLGFARVGDGQPFSIFTIELAR